jgi:hypothetical protein
MFFAGPSQGTSTQVVHHSGQSTRRLLAAGRAPAPPIERASFFRHPLARDSIRYRHRQRRPMRAAKLQVRTVSTCAGVRQKTTGNACEGGTSKFRACIADIRYPTTFPRMFQATSGRSRIDRKV